MLASYPNPTSDVINIDLLSQTNEEATFARARTITIYDIRLYNSHGNIVRQTTTTGDNIQFNVSNLPAGIYYLHIYDGTNETPEIQQIVIDR
jgi:hypothetical protein